MITPDPECDAIVRAFSKRETRARAALPVASRDPVFRRKGFSFDLKTIREYQPFDDPRAIDWKLYGRTDRAYVKEFFEEESDGATVVLDVSASMSEFPKRIFDAFSYSICYVLASLGFSLSIIAFNDRPAGLVTVKRKRALHDLSSLLTSAVFSRNTDLSLATRAARLSSPFRRLIVLSDFHDTRFDPAASGFSQVYLLRLRMPFEHEADDAMEIEATDRETGRRVVIPWDSQSRARYVRHERRRMDALSAQPRVALFAQIEPNTPRAPVYRAIADRLYA